MWYVLHQLEITRQDGQHGGLDLKKIRPTLKSVLSPGYVVTFK